MDVTDLMVSEENILSYVDEYTLYCFYLEFEPDIKLNYLSPLRPDDQYPSFGIYPSKKLNREYFWKDSGGKGDSGEIFKLIKLLYSYSSTQQVIDRIKCDFNLGGIPDGKEKIIHNTAVIRSDADIRVVSKAFNFMHIAWWQQWNINLAILEKFRVSAINYYWMTAEQKAPIFPGVHSYVYRIRNNYMLYFPNAERNKKFRNDLKQFDVLGWEQLTFTTDTLIITKSYKDVMCLYSYGYEAVSPRSENIPMPDGFFSWAESKYKNILVLFDNDMKHRGEWYPYKKVYVPIESGSKDTSDFTRDFGPILTSQMLKTILR